MKNKTKLSVVVPFYNETSFLATAVQSILSQGIEDFEVLIVNDNPDKFESEFFSSLGFPEHVKVIHHDKNKGLPSSRNTGISAAQGEFIAFLDADDYYLPLGLRNHLAYAEKMGADITHAQTVITHVNQTSGYVIAPDASYFGKSAIGRYQKDDVLNAGFYIESSWSSIYRASFLSGKNVRFDETQVKFEDRIFVIEALTAADSIAIFGEPCRVWRKRNNSITTSAKSHADQLLKLNLFKKSIELWLKNGGANARHLAAQEIVRQLCYMITKNETSPWYGCFGFGDSAEDLQLSDAISDILADFGLKQEELILAYNAKSPRYSEDSTGSGRITPNDLYDLTLAISEKNYAKSRDIILKAVKRADGYAVPYLSKNNSSIKILLHFGLHKTGSTHIQHQLSENRSILKNNGILFPETGLGFPQGKEPVRPNGLPGHQALISGLFQDDTSLLDQLKGEILGSGCSTIIISAENLSQPDASVATRTRRVRKIVDILEEIGRVTPVILYRRPDKWLESYYRELAGNGAPVAYQSPGEFLVNNSRILDFSGIVKSIEDACDTEAILLSFEDMVSQEPDLAYEFLKRCGFDLPFDQFSFKTGTQYPSTCNVQLELARMISVFVKDQETRQNILRTFYTQVSSTAMKSGLFTSRERVEIIEGFCDSAESLFEARGIPSLRETWLENSLLEGEPEKTHVPAEYLDALWISGVMNGTTIAPAKLTNQSDIPLQSDYPVAQVSERQLQSILSDRELFERNMHELAYMKSSVSWMLTRPLRLIMHTYKILRSRL